MSTASAERGFGSPSQSSSVTHLDNNGRVIQTIDGNGNNVALGYDLFDRVTSVTDAIGDRIDLVYNRRDELIERRVFDVALGTYIHHAQFDYDELRRMIRSSEVSVSGPAVTLETEFTYRTDSRLDFRKSPRDNDTTFGYDTARRLTSVTDALGNVTSFTLDANGNRTSMTSNEVVPSSANEVYEVEHDYDALNRVVAQRVLDNATSTVLTTTPEYDLRHNQVRVTDSIGRVHTAVYDLANRRLTGTEDSTGLSIQTTYQYDLDDLLTVLTDADGFSTSSTYDGKGRTTQVGYETGLFEAYAYDLADRLLTPRTQDGVLTIFSYNSDNTLSARTAGALREEFTWNALDQPKSADRLDGGVPESLLAFVYDGFSRLATEGQGACDVLHTYDASHNPVTCKYPTGGPTLTYAFDELERMTSFHDGGPNLVDYEFAGPGRLHSRTTNHAIGSIAQSFTWDGLRRLTGMDAGAVHELTYAYDDFNRRTFKQSHHAPLNGVGDVYDYDGGSRLSDIAYDAPSPPSSVGAASYLKIVQSKVQARTQTTLTVGGPPVVTTWASDALHQTTDIGAVERFYDQKGNLTDDGEGLYYAYDAWNRLTEVSDSGGTLVSYELDALGRRSTRIEAGGQTTRYVYSGAQLLEEYVASAPSGTFTLKIRYLYGAGLDELVALEDEVGARYFVFQDALGSVEAITDWNGVVLERYRYDAFGQPTVTNGAGTVTYTDAVTGRPKSPLGNSLWFTGARWDPESGNYHMRARQYEPKTGRFVSRDPLGYVDGPNAYTYGLPVRRVRGADGDERGRDDDVHRRGDGAAGVAARELAVVYRREVGPGIGELPHARAAVRAEDGAVCEPRSAGVRGRAERVHVRSVGSGELDRPDGAGGGWWDVMGRPVLELELHEFGVRQRRARSDTRSVGGRR